MCHLPGRVQKCNSPFQVHSSCQRMEGGICTGSLGEKGRQVSNQLVGRAPGKLASWCCSSRIICLLDTSGLPKITLGCSEGPYPVNSTVRPKRYTIARGLWDKPWGSLSQSLPDPRAGEQLPPLRHGFWLQAVLGQQHWVRACLSSQPTIFFPWPSGSNLSPLTTTASRQPSKPKETFEGEFEGTRPPSSRCLSVLRP